MNDDNKPKSGHVPEGYIRFNSNIKKELHKRLKILSVNCEKTMGEIVEEWIDRYAPH